MTDVVATSTSIKKQVNANVKDAFAAINEYIWNSFDAQATRVEIAIHEENKFFKGISISDNGFGIDYEKLKQFFGKFNDSHKVVEKDKSLPRGQKGYGRFSFIKFADKATWVTVYSDTEKKYKYAITCDGSTLNKFNETPKKETTELIGTQVKFTMVHPIHLKALTCDGPDIYAALKKSIIREFCWFIELNSAEIILNGIKINANENIDKKID